MASATLNSSQHLAIASAASDQGIASAPVNPNVENSLIPSQWSPSHDTLLMLVNLLKDTSHSNAKAQIHLYVQLQKYATLPDFNNYLVYILVNGCSYPDSTLQQVEVVRQAAGLLLKNNIRVLYTALHPQRREYINSQLLAVIGDTSNIVRLVAATCISTIVACTNDIVNYNGLISTLIQCLDSNRPTYLDGALTVLSHLAEELPHIFHQGPSGPLDSLLPKIIHFCHHQSNATRAKALQILNHLILVMPPALYTHIDVFCQALFSVAADSSAQVRKRVCTAICLLLETTPKSLAPFMASIIDYMLVSSDHPDELIAREASEFWCLIAHSEGAADLLRPFLPRLVPVFLKNMVYSPDEVALFDAGNTPDDMVPDRQEDIKPRFHHPRFKDSGSVGSIITADNIGRADENGQVCLENGTGKSNVHSLQSGNGRGPGNRCSDGDSNGDSHLDDSDDDEDWDDWEEYRGEADWNVRKCSAAALDVFAGLFKEELLEVLLPSLQEKLMNGECWEQRECGVLALGAIADGCYSGMMVHMHVIFPFLLRSVSDQHYMVRSISCWTLSRYSRWIMRERDDGLLQQPFKVLLERFLDQNKLVQKASCSALAVFAEDCGPLLSSYLTPILRTLTAAFERYQQRNLIVLYDIVCTLAEAVGSELGNPEHMNMLMSVLISRWNSFADTDPSMLSLLECLGHVFRALGVRSQQFASSIFSRCANIMDGIYVKESKGQKEDIHVEFLTCCLDLICALAEALGPSVDPFVGSNGNGSRPVLPLLFMCMKDSRQEVRQSAFALLGELARARLPSLIPALPEYVRCAVEALNPKYMSVSNNATWALGELVMMAGFLPPNVPVNRDMIQRTLLDGALDPLIRVVNVPQLNKSLLENSALTLGRMGLVMPESIAPRLCHFAKAVFASLRNIRDDVEKEQAFHGMNAMVKLNPTAIIECFVYYVDAIASWFHCKPDLELEFASILSSFKTSLGEQWFSLRGSFPPTLQGLLKERFAV